LPSRQPRALSLFGRARASRAVPGGPLGHRDRRATPAVCRRAHEEIRSFLEAEEHLRAWGVQTVLIGSYARRTGIHPGKDVDVFTKLANLAVEDTDPRTIYDAVRTILVARYQARAEPQNRSVKINFDPEGFEFSVDVVPAVRLSSRWAIPRRDREVWDQPDERWVETDPEYLGELTTELNGKFKVGGQGAYVPTVKLVRQTRRHHRDTAKPGGFYFELMTYWAFERGDVWGATFAELFSSTLASIANQLESGRRLTDPVLIEDYRPEPELSDRIAAASVFLELAAKARQAISTDDVCKAAALWREVLGRNGQDWCFPIPRGCDEHGRKLAVTAPAISRGSREPGRFA
jgi:Second Messenger Oligonucleotide or Dinucleotide Synthetase domain